MKPRLYFAPNTCALAPQIALHEASIDHEAVRVDFPSRQQTSPIFLAINPKGRVPVLVTASGAITETPAILGFIARSSAGSGLAPLHDSFALAQMESFNSYLCSTVHVAHAHGRRGYRWADDETAQAAMKRKVADNMVACFHLLESKMVAGPWVMGEQFTVCDPYLFTVTRWLALDNIDRGRFPKIAVHFARMMDRQSVQRSLAFHDA
jgi:glutathione S-transferase